MQSRQDLCLYKEMRGGREGFGKQSLAGSRFKYSVWLARGVQARHGFGLIPRVVVGQTKEGHAPFSDARISQSTEACICQLLVLPPREKKKTRLTCEAALPGITVFPSISL